MTLMGGGERGTPEYEGTGELLLPSLTAADWAEMDYGDSRALIATLRIARSIAAAKGLPKHLGPASTAVISYIRRLERLLAAFPKELRDQPEAHAMGTKKTVWELYKYGPEVFARFPRSPRWQSGGGPGSARGLGDIPDLDLNVIVFQRFQQELETVELKDRRTEPTPVIDPKHGPVVDLGCDMKQLVIALSAIGPVRCEIWADPAFKRLGSTAQAGAAVKEIAARISSYDPKQDSEDYVTVVASRGNFTRPLRDVILEVERAHPQIEFEVEYLLRRTDEDGHTTTGWGDGGHAWISHKLLRQMLRWARVPLPPSFVGAAH
jgi:hypothetical protein